MGLSGVYVGRKYATAVTGRDSRRGVLESYIQDVVGMRGWRMLGFGKRWECDKIGI